MAFFKRNKYGAKLKHYGGNVYHSQAEANYAAFLDASKKAVNPADRVVRYDRQVKVSLDVNGVHITNYYCDFLVFFADNRVEYQEVKGFATNEWRFKEKLFRALYPDRILRVIKV